MMTRTPRPAKKKGAAASPAVVSGRIVALLCENSSYLAYRDAGGASALKGVEAVRLPCAGRVEAGLVLKLLEKGARGVLVAGCPRDDCSFIKGNCRAEKRVAAVRAILREAGLDDERVRMAWISSLDPGELRDAVRRFARST